jgi:hypothetical protein
MTEDQLQTFLPLCVRKNVDSLRMAPAALRQRCVIAMLDLKNYSKITRNIITADTSMLATDKFNITQQVGNLVRTYMNPAIKTLTDQGADLLKFGGDSVVLVWPLSEAFELPNQETFNTTLDQKIVQQALKSCLQVFEDINNTESNDSFKDLKVSFHGSFHIGFIDIVRLGSLKEFSRCEPAFFGSDLKMVGDMLKFADKSDELIITKDVVDLLGWSSILKKNKRREVQVNGKQCVITYPVDGKSLPLNEGFTNPFNTSASVEDRVVENLVDVAVIESLNEASPAVDCVALEHLRDVTVLFIGISGEGFPEYGGKYETDLEYLIRINNIYSTIMVALQSFNGLLRQCSNDDKGVSFICIFGLPPSIHEKTSLPAVKCAIKIYEDILISNLAAKCHIGISTGRAYSGLIGNALCVEANKTSRFEHAILGEPLNLASRLMSFEKAQSSMYCDERTYANVKGLVANVKATCDEITLKGWDYPVTIYHINTNEFLRSVSNIVLSESSSTSGLSSGIIFNDEKFDSKWIRILGDWNALANENATDDRKNIIVLEGITGSGKSTNMERIIAFVGKDSWLVWKLPSYEADSNTPFTATKHLLKLFRETVYSNPEMFSLQKGDLPEEHLFMKTKIYSEILKRLGVNVTQAESVVNHLTKNAKSNLNLISSGNLLSFEQETSETLIDDMIDVFCPLLNAIGKLQPILLVFDDIQWQDSFSWRLTNAIAHKCTNVFLLILSRPASEYNDISLKKLYERICALNNVERFIINRISKETLRMNVERIFELRAIKRDRYDTVITRIADVIYERTGGTALAVNCMLVHLRKIFMSEDFNISNITNLNAVSIIPQNSNAIIVAQFDKLSPNFRKILKTAALIGQLFNVEMVGKIHNLEYSDEQIEEEDRFYFLEKVQDRMWKFRHCLIQSYIDATMTQEQRVLLHASIATFYHDLLKAKSEAKRIYLPIVYRQYTEAKNVEMSFKMGVKMIKMYSEIGMTVEIERLYKRLDPELLKNMEKKKLVQLNVLVCFSANSNGTFGNADGINMALVISTLRLLGIDYPKGKIGRIRMFLKLLKENEKAWLEGSYLPTFGLPFLAERKLQKIHEALPALHKFCETLFKLETASSSCINTLLVTFLNMNAHLAFQRMGYKDPVSENINDECFGCFPLNYVFFSAMMKLKPRDTILKTSYWNKPVEEDELLHYLDELSQARKNNQPLKGKPNIGNVINYNALSAVYGNNNITRTMMYFKKSEIFSRMDVGTSIDIENVFISYAAVVTESGISDEFLFALNRWVDAEENYAAEGAKPTLESVTPILYSTFLIHELGYSKDKSHEHLVRFLRHRAYEGLEFKEKAFTSRCWSFGTLLEFAVFEEDYTNVEEYSVKLLHELKVLARNDHKQLCTTSSAIATALLRVHTALTFHKRISLRIRKIWDEIFQVIFIGGFKKRLKYYIGYRRVMYYVFKAFAKLSRPPNKVYTPCGKSNKVFAEGDLQVRLKATIKDLQFTIDELKCLDVSLLRIVLKEYIFYLSIRLRCNTTEIVRYIPETRDEIKLKEEITRFYEQVGYHWSLKQFLKITI